jgi:hypothetical protein
MVASEAKRVRKKRMPKPAPFDEPNPKEMQHPNSLYCVKGAPPATVMERKVLKTPEVSQQGSSRGLCSGLWSGEG